MRRNECARERSSAGVPFIARLLSFVADDDAKGRETS
jgi:hypothetical protein